MFPVLLASSYGGLTKANFMTGSCGKFPYREFLRLFESYAAFMYLASGSYGTPCGTYIEVCIRTLKYVTTASFHFLTKS